MSFLSTSPPTLFYPKTPNLHLHHHHPSLSLLRPLYSLSSLRHFSPKPSSSFRLSSLSSSSSPPDEWGDKSGSDPQPESSYTKFNAPDPALREEDEDEWGPEKKDSGEGESSAAAVPDEWGEIPGSDPEPISSFTKFIAPDPSIREDEDEWGPEKNSGEGGSPASAVPDEWGEKSAPEPELESAYTRFTGPDPSIGEDADEWGRDGGTVNGGSGVEGGSGNWEGKESNKNWELKKILVDTVSESGFGFRASAEVRAEASELVSQLEAVNPIPSPVESPELLDGTWVLVYTAASELLPLLAAGNTPLLKVEQISQAIDTAKKTVENSTTLAGPFATCSFSATASFEVRTSSRIQVQFKEVTFKPPEIKSQINVPESVDVFGQTIPLSPVKQLLNPLQDAAASISRTLYGLPPLKIPLPGERTESWLLITYLDEDLRISRGDGGGLFVLVREGSSLLEK